MSDLVLRRSPSGPAVELDDTLVEPGQVLGLPLEAPTAGFAVPLDGESAGTLFRFNRVFDLPLAAGTYDSIALPNGTRIVDVTPTGAVLIGGFIMPPVDAGAGVVVRKRGPASSGTLQLLHNNTATPVVDRIFTTGQVLFTLTEDNDSVFLPRVQLNGGRWQTRQHLKRPSSLYPVPLGAYGISFMNRTVYVATGAAPDDVTVSLSLPANTLLYDAMLLTGTGAGGSSATLRTASGGGGIALTTALSTAASGTARNNGTAPSSLVMGSQLFLRRTNGNTTGQLLLWCRPLP